MTIYKTISGFDCYRVGDDGTVWSRKSGRWRLLKPYPNQHGQLHVELFKAKFTNRRRYVAKVHRLVLEAFVGPCPINCECCHNDGNPANNRVENLRWDTHANNIADTLRHGTRAVGSRCGTAKLSEQDAAEIRRLHFHGGIRKSELARRFNLDPTTVAALIAGKTWRHVAV